MKNGIIILILLASWSVQAQAPKLSAKKIEALKKEAADKVNAKQAQVMVDKVFSFAELGFQEFESSKYLTNLLKENGFKIIATSLDTNNNLKII